MDKSLLILNLSFLGNNIKSFIKENKGIEKYQLKDILNNHDINNFSLLYFNNKFDISIYDFNDYKIEISVTFNKIIVEILTQKNEPVKLLEL